MNKVAFSAIFIILFGAYVFSQRLNPPETLPATPPAQVETAPSAQNEKNGEKGSWFSDDDDDDEEGEDDDRTPIAIRTTPIPGTVTSTNPPAPSAPIQYKNGSYTGGVADATYGNIQVKAIIAGGKITDVQFLETPGGRQTSIDINAKAKPLLVQEAIQAQSALVNGVSGATFSSKAFIESLTSALAQAK